MLAIVSPDGLENVLAICDRWDVQASVVGRVTEGGLLRVRDGVGGPVLAELPAASLHEDAPLYDRPRRPPADWEDLKADTAEQLPPPENVGADLLAMLADPSWVYHQYDHMLFCNTVVGPGGDATVLRLKHPAAGADTGRGLALTADGNHRWCAVDPRAGTAMTVAEAVLNLACVGARPLALVNCLNFGNPEHPEVMWQFSEAVDGMAEACDAFGIPVVGGNVSLYNESNGHNIDPTPVIGLLGVIDSLTHIPPGLAWCQGDRVIVLGEGSAELSGSLWAASVAGHKRGRLPSLDYEQHRQVAGLVAGLVADDRLSAVHDVSSGGLGVALAEMAAASGVGFRGARIHNHGELFGEASSRAVAAVDPELLPEVEAAAAATGVSVARIGLAAGDRFSIKGLLDLDMSAITDRWRSAMSDSNGQAQ
ncbi:MAG: AIR synthase related protein [bacterium]|nr:AIR synthase related protein [bacterium]